MQVTASSARERGIRDDAYLLGVLEVLRGRRQLAHHCSHGGELRGRKVHVGALTQPVGEVARGRGHHCRLVTHASLQGTQSHAYLLINISEVHLEERAGAVFLRIEAGLLGSLLVVPAGALPVPVSDKR
jgi:hypothetical protein